MTETGCSTPRNVYTGSNAIQDFLNPDNYSPTPLVELPACLNPYTADKVRIFAKLMYMLPLLNIKSLPAINMLMHARDCGQLKGVHTLVEASSGNTVASLSVIAPLFGIPKTAAIVPWDIAQGKLEILRLTGAEPQLKRDAPNTPTAIQEAGTRGQQEGYFNPGQYSNEANPDAYEKWLAPQLWEQMDGKMTVMATGLGTTGTVVGCSRYFRKHDYKVSLVCVICPPDEAVPGVRNNTKLKEIQFDWRGRADAIVEAHTAESFLYSLRLCRSGIMAGPSSGFALAGLLHHLEQSKQAGKLDSMRNADGEVVAAVICGDTPLPYLDKYTTHLNPSDF